MYIYIYIYIYRSSIRSQRPSATGFLFQLKLNMVFEYGDRVEVDGLVTPDLQIFNHCIGTVLKVGPDGCVMIQLLTLHFAGHTLQVPAQFLNLVPLITRPSASALAVPPATSMAAMNWNKWASSFAAMVAMYERTPAWWRCAGFELFTYMFAKLVHSVQGNDDRNRAVTYFRGLTLQHLMCVAIWTSEDLTLQERAVYPGAYRDCWVPAIVPTFACTYRFQVQEVLIPCCYTLRMALFRKPPEAVHNSRISRFTFGAPEAFSELSQTTLLGRLPLGVLRPEEFQEMEEKLINQPPPPWVHWQRAESQQHDAQSAAPAAVCTQHTDLGPPNQPTVASQSRPQNPQPGSESQPSQLPEQGTNTSGTPPNVGFRTVDGWLCP